MTGKLTTHILDTANGRPAAGVRVVLFRLDPSGAAVELARTVTNADGRTDAPLLAGEDFRPGTYLIEFAVGDYFSEGFLDRVPVRFRVEDGAAHYHVPLLCSPWAYSTYRGS
jgi:5-hydroxyisourate hydrolase